MDFPHFGSLPPEIRAFVWAYALPDPRVYEIMDVPGARQRMSPTAGLMFANLHDEPPPALAAVCRESRAFVLHRYRPLTLNNTTKYVDLSRDLLLLEPYLLLRRLQRALHFMGRVPLIRNRLEVLALGTSYGVHTGICHPVLSWRGGGGGRDGSGTGGLGGLGGNNGNGSAGSNGSASSASSASSTAMAKLLAGLAQFPRLKSLVFIVHQEFQFAFSPAIPSLLSSSSSSSSSSSLSSMTSMSSAPLPPPSTPTGSLTHTYTHTHAYSGMMPPPALSFHPQVIHQAYRFKFDVEANINQHPHRRPHVNEMLFYPLKENISAGHDRDRDDWDSLLREATASMVPTGATGLGATSSGPLGSGSLVPDFANDGDWCDPWPTNDDWRRFKRSFQRAVIVTLQRTGALRPGGAAVRGNEKQRNRLCGNIGGSNGSASRPGSSRNNGSVRQPQIGHNLPAIKGASLLWRYLGV